MLQEWFKRVLICMFYTDSRSLFEPSLTSAAVLLEEASFKLFMKTGSENVILKNTLLKEYSFNKCLLFLPALCKMM